MVRSYSFYLSDPFVSDGEGAELLVYLVDGEKDIYIGVLVLVCHLASRAQPS
jgi:hypothetical protein